MNHAINNHDDYDKDDDDDDNNNNQPKGCYMHALSQRAFPPFAQNTLEVLSIFEQQI